jgi:hypothetical protein
MFKNCKEVHWVFDEVPGEKVFDLPFNVKFQGLHVYRRNVSD